MMRNTGQEGICKLNTAGNGCDYLRVLISLESRLRNNTDPKEKIELLLKGTRQRVCFRDLSDYKSVTFWTTNEYNIIQLKCDFLCRAMEPIPTPIHLVLF
jgi:hypothetical protein